MSRKKDRYEKPEITKQADYYRLKTQAVQDLVTADESNSPEVSQAELNAYRSGPKIMVSDWVKMAFIKFWFPGAVCFFFIWGLSSQMATELDLLFVTGMALGIVTDMLTNNVIRFLEKTPGANDRWMMFPRKGYITFPLNILYAYVVLFLVYGLYNGINLLAVRITGRADVVFLGVEPVLFGLFYMGFDTLLIGLKHLVVRLIHGAAGKAVRQGGQT